MREDDLVRVDVDKGAVLVGLIQKLLQHAGDQLRQLDALEPAGTRLVVNTHAELDLSKVQRALGGNTTAGDVDVLETRANADEVLGSQAGNLDDLGQRPSLLSQSTSNLVHEHGSSNTTTADLAAFALPTPTSSPTTSISTSRPAARAFSTATPKLRTSPV